MGGGKAVNGREGRCAGAEGGFKDAQDAPRSVYDKEDNVPALEPREAPGQEDGGGAKATHL